MPVIHEDDADDAARNRRRIKVAVADGGDGDDSPPNAVPERLELALSLTVDWTAPATTTRKIIANATKRNVLPDVSRRSA
jgi:hypothetical protein